MKAVFDLDNEGWSVISFVDLDYYYGSYNYNIMGTYAASYDSSGGNSGGYISSTDPDEGYFTFAAPATFLGNQSQFYNGTLSYDIFHLGSIDVHPSELLLVGGGMQLLWQSSPALIPTSNWSTVDVLLAPAAQWKVGTPKGTLATTADFQTVLGDLTGLYILGEYTNGPAETTGLDNIQLATITTYNFNGHTYLLSNAGTWLQAQAEAQTLGGNLVAIDNQAEQDWLSATFGSMGSMAENALWIGYTDQVTEGTFKWISGDNSTYTNWSGSEPNNVGNEEDYVEMYSDGKWNDLPISLAGWTPLQGIIEITTNVAVTAGVTPVENGTTGTFSLTLDNLAPAGGLTVNYTLAGTATLTTDYTVTAGSNLSAVTGSSFTIAAGQTSATLNVNALKDFVLDTNETVNLNLTAGTGYQLAQSNASLTIIDTPFNTAPTAASKTITFNEDDSYRLAATDLGYADNEGDALASVKITSLPAAGVFKLGATAVTLNQVIPAASLASLTFSPAANANGASYASFNFTVNDGSLDSVATTEISFKVTAVNDPPTDTATAVLIAGVEDIAYTVSAANLLVGFSDVDGDALAVANLVANHGTVVSNTNGTFTIKPTANYNRVVNLTYNVYDGHGGGIGATQSFTLTPVRDDLNLVGTSGKDNLRGDQIDANSYDRLSGLAGDDKLSGVGGDDTLRGSAGNDTVNGGNGNDVLSANAGNDVVNGDAGNDLLNGGTGDDALNGGVGNDVLSGNDGKDTLNGGVGKDKLTGGIGADFFMFTDDTSKASMRDVITDFKRSDSDKINLHAMDANTLVSGNQDFTFIGSAKFSGAGQLRFDATTDVLSANVDGNNNTVEFSVQLTGVSSLQASDFSL